MIFITYFLETLEHRGNLLRNYSVSYIKINEYELLTKLCLKQFCIQIEGQFYQNSRRNIFLLFYLSVNVEMKIKKELQYFPKFLWDPWETFLLHSTIEYRRFYVIAFLSIFFHNFTFEIENKEQFPFLDIPVIGNCIN